MNVSWYELENLRVILIPMTRIFQSGNTLLLATGRRMTRIIALTLMMADRLWMKTSERLGRELILDCVSYWYCDWSLLSVILEL
jgi:hypothetical protein